MILVDLIHQVQKVLPVRFGGTGNTSGWAVDSMIGAYPNGTGSTIAKGTVVQLAKYANIGGDWTTDNRIKPTTTASQQNVVGVVIGRFRFDEPIHQFEEVDCEDGDSCAVVIAGKAYTLVEGTVEVDQYAYSAATDGKATGSDTLAQGGMGTWESGGTTRQWLRIWGAPATPGVAGAILVVLGDGEAPITVGSLVDIPAPPFSIRLTHWTLVSTLSGSISLDIYKDTYANFPPTAPDSATDTTPPYITSGIKNEDDVPGPIQLGGLPPAGGWDRDINNGDMLRVIVESADGGVKQVSLLLDYIRR